MGFLFLKVLNMSLIAAVVALMVMALRGVVGKWVPRLFSYLLWTMVFVRMLIPFSIPVPSAIWGNGQLGTWISGGGASGGTGMAGMGGPNGSDQLAAWPQLVSGENGQAGSVHPQGGTPSADVMVLTDQGTGWGMYELLLLLAVIWLLGVVFLLVRSCLEYHKMGRVLRTAFLFQNQNLIAECEREVSLRRSIPVYLSEQVRNPFVFGIFRKKVILPAELGLETVNQSHLKNVLFHEFYHVKRFDPLVKLIAFAALCIHWFNPLLWVAFRMFEKDMEMSCDEMAVAHLGEKKAPEYAETLLELAAGRCWSGLGGVLTFSESNVGDRIKNIVKYRRPEKKLRMISAAALLVCAVVLMLGPAPQPEQQARKATALLLFGLESAEDRGELNPVDASMLVEYDFNSGKVTVLSIPRDTLLPNGESLKNSGWNNPQETAEQLEELLQVRIPYYVKLDTSALRTVVDEMGGVKFNVPLRMKYEDPYYMDQGLSIDLEAGKQLLDGNQSEMLLRFRKGDGGTPTYPLGDLDRINTQQEFLKALLSQIDLNSFLNKTKTLYQIYEGSDTNLSIGAAMDWLGEIKDKGLSANRLTFLTLPGQAEIREGVQIWMISQDEKELEPIRSTFQ